MNGGSALKLLVASYNCPLTSFSIRPSVVDLFFLPMWISHIKLGRRKNRIGGSAMVFEWQMFLRRLRRRMPAAAASICTDNLMANIIETGHGYACSMALFIISCTYNVLTYCLLVGPYKVSSRIISQFHRNFCMNSGLTSAPGRKMNLTSKLLDLIIC